MLYEKTGVKCHLLALFCLIQQDSGGKAALTLNYSEQKLRQLLAKVEEEKLKNCLGKIYQRI